MGAVFPVYASFFVVYKSETHRLFFVVGCLVAGLAVGMFAFLIGRGTILRIVKRLARQLESLCAAEGDLTQELQLNSSDCLGELASNFNQFLGKLRRLIRRLKEVSDRTDQIVYALGSTSEQSAAAIEEMSATTTQVSKVAQSQYERTSESAATIKSVLDQVEKSDELTQGMAAQFFLFSQSMESNRRGIGAVASEAESTGRLAEILNTKGERGHDALEDLMSSVAEVAEKAEEIRNIVQAILDIASKTDLLSMNAAIEAAHAGDAGKGFAVVAEEIRKLAETSADEGETIKALLQGISDSIQTTSERSHAAMASFEDLRRDIDAVRSASQTIASAMTDRKREDEQLTESLSNFADYYGRLSDVLREQVQKSRFIHDTLATLEMSSRQIETSMNEQRIGMEESTKAAEKLRDTTVTVRDVTDDLKRQIGSFRVD